MMENAGSLIVNVPEALYVVRGNGRMFLNSTDGGCMKKVIWGRVAFLSVCATSLVFAQAETPKIDQRQGNQEKRIDQGIASGQLK